MQGQPKPGLKSPLDRLSSLCLRLPEAKQEDMGRHAAFTVRNRKFAYFLDDHHGDGIVSVCVRAELGENEALVDSEPERYYIPAYLGSRGWVAIRLDVETVDWNGIREQVVASYLMAAPASLRRLVGQV